MRKISWFHLASLFLAWYFSLCFRSFKSRLTSRVCFLKVRMKHKYSLTVACWVIETLQGRIATPPLWLITLVLFLVIKWLCTCVDREFLCMFFRSFESVKNTEIYISQNSPSLLLSFVWFQQCTFFEFYSIWSHAMFNINYVLCAFFLQSITMLNRSHSLIWFCIKGREFCWI
jgi:hypothetical protein